MANVDISYLSLAHVVQLSELSSVKITIIAECTPIPTGRVTAMHGVGVALSRMLSSVQPTWLHPGNTAGMCVCMYICVYVCSYVCMHVRMYI